MQPKILTTDSYFKNFDFQEQGTGCGVEQEPQSGENYFFAQTYLPKDFFNLDHPRQSSPEFDQHYDGFLQVGQSILGAAYFEQNASWGNNYPRVDERNFTKVKITVKDAFGSKYSKTFEVPIKTIQDAFRYNTRFGLTEHYFDKDVIEDKVDEESKETEGGGK